MDWKVVLSAVLFVVVLVIALGMRKKIKPNDEENRGLFKPYTLKVEEDEFEEEYEDEDEEEYEDDIDDEGEEDETE